MATNGAPSTGTGERLRSYSPARRTALVLTGTGADGAYHAGVLRALQEAGVKIDLLAGHGVGAAAAALAAIDGGSRLWEQDGIWRSAATGKLYSWTRPLVTAVIAGLAAAFTLVLAALATVFDAQAGFVTGAAALAVFVAGVAVVAWMLRRLVPGRRTQGRWWWALAGAPLDAARARDVFAATIWQLIRGGAPEARPASAVIGRRLCEVLRDNLGQPGFREMILIATDLDARCDVVAALLAEPWRADFFAPRGGELRNDVLDLSGPYGAHAFDIVAGALTPGIVCDPAAVTFARDSFWRGETHRFCHRPGSLHRLLDEVAAAGATQVIVVSATSRAAQPHHLRVPHLDVRSRLGEFEAAAGAAALRDALETARLWFEAVYVISPEHNPVGPYDMSGAYDEASDRHQDLDELIERAYEDAHRQFIEPVIGASGEQIARTPAPGSGAAAGVSGHVGSFEDIGAADLRDLD